MPVPVTSSVLRRWESAAGNTKRPGRGDLRIERICRLEIGAVVGIGQIVHVLGIGGHSTGLMQLVDVIAEGGYNITDRPTKKTRIRMMVLLFFFMGYSLML